MATSEGDPYFDPRGKFVAGPRRPRRDGLLALASLIALGAESFLGFGLGFAPGWANGWPGGLTIYRVWSAGMTTILFAILVTGAIGIGALVGILLGRTATPRRYAGMAFGIWLCACISLAVPTCYWFYCETYASALEMWPAGYNP
jgi:hypothetical protein